MLESGTQLDYSNLRKIKFLFINDILFILIMQNASFSIIIIHYFHLLWSSCNKVPAFLVYLSLFYGVTLLGYRIISRLS